MREMFIKELLVKWIITKSNRMAIKEGIVFIHNHEEKNWIKY